ncbi:hypothetical protein CYMTET_41412 [Cymbomonas tetramitiformis]|uniref:Uncharacterized protein n=1 Tax=Cymbomonas tetramitiformis TaxID=36881 RepID=A0AAE0C769_9CHLO|nr:hypothetical protein CYMTET_41412 [Cymbomonas tetramitiformis]
MKDIEMYKMSTLCTTDAQWALLRNISRDDAMAVRSHLLSKETPRLCDTALAHAMVSGSVTVMKMYVEEFDTDFVICSTLAEMALESGHLELFKWGVCRTMEAGLKSDVQAKACKRNRAADDNSCEWSKWLEAVGYMTVVAVRSGGTDALAWMLTGEYKEYFHDPFPEFSLCTEAVDNRQWETLRFLVNHGVKGLTCAQTRASVLGAVKNFFCGDELNSAMLVLRDAFEKSEPENVYEDNTRYTADA